MSAVVKTITPFVNQDCLCQALDELGVKYSIDKLSIITERKDYRGFQSLFLKKDNIYFGMILMLIVAVSMAIIKIKKHGKQLLLF